MHLHSREVSFSAKAEVGNADSLKTFISGEAALRSLTDRVPVGIPLKRSGVASGFQPGLTEQTVEFAPGTDFAITQSKWAGFAALAALVSAIAQIIEKASK
jgi:hypothetical protein